MKIIYLVHQFFPEFQTGTEKFVLNNALMSQKSGNKVKIITYSFLDDDNFDHDNGEILFRTYLYHGIPVIAYKYKLQPDDIHSALENQILKNFAITILQKETPDIIHVGHAMRVHEFIWSAMKLNIPYIITLTDFFLLCPKVFLTPNNHSLCSGPQNGKACEILCKEFSKTYIKQRLSKSEEILNHSKKIISPSKFLKTIFNNEYKKINIQIIPHGIDQKFIKQNEKVYSQNHPITFGFAGSLIQHKGVDVLLRAFHQIQNVEAKLEIYGSGMDFYVDYLKKFSINDQRITFHGKYESEQLAEVMENIDVLVAPSLSYENYPLVLHEALASHVPVIATDLGGMAEKITDEINGYTFKPGDPADLRKKMDVIIRNPNVLNPMKTNIKENMVIPKVEQEAYEYLEIYRNVIKRS
jgi:glycosyltransferase involved in cell wall biosynthesis